MASATISAVDLFIPRKQYNAAEEKVRQALTQTHLKLKIAKWFKKSFEMLFGVFFWIALAIPTFFEDYSDLSFWQGIGHFFSQFFMWLLFAPMLAVLYTSTMFFHLVLLKLYLVYIVYCPRGVVAGVLSPITLYGLWKVFAASG